ncbi:hypothetical protein HKX48_007091 [Thoreauomyces humboldtii]|nr:hypothetical protein HKX48_007091 [Thoreauomyces humboldtii]
MSVAGHIPSPPRSPPPPPAELPHAFPSLVAFLGYPVILRLLAAGPSSSKRNVTPPDSPLESISGHLLNVDPDSLTIVLGHMSMPIAPGMQEQEEKRPLEEEEGEDVEEGELDGSEPSRPRFTVVMGHALHSVQVDPYSDHGPDPLTHRQVDELLSHISGSPVTTSTSTATATTAERVRTSLVAFLERNGITATETEGSDPTVLCLISGAVTVRPPYTSLCVEGVNDILVERVKDVVDLWRASR